MADARADMREVCDEEYKLNLGTHLNSLRLDIELTDVNLCAGDDAIPCHKVVLSAGCPYFHAMFTSGLKETTSDEVHIEHIEPDVLHLVVVYLYTGQLSVTDTDVQGLCQAADVFGLAKVKNKCEEIMISQLDAANCIGFYNFANIYHLPSLKYKSRKTMLMSFQAVVLGQEFNEMTEIELTDYITDDQLDVSHEGHLFEAVVQWVNHNTELRRHCFDKIVQQIPLNMCSYAYLSDVVRKEPLMQTQRCKDYLLEAFANNSSNMAPPAQVQYRLVVGGGLSLNQINTQLWSFDEQQRVLQWKSYEQIPEKSHISSMCDIANKIVITGGTIQNIPSSKCWLLDTITKEWRSLPEMTIARSRHKSVGKDNGVFVFGGVGILMKPISSVEYLNLKTMQWNKKAPLPKALIHQMGVICGDQAFVLGGRDESDHDRLENFAFDVVKNMWKTCSPMPERCFFTSAVCIRGKIYVVGGFSKNCLSYNPQVDQWLKLTRPQYEHGDCAALMWNNFKILLCGGRYRSGKELVGDGSKIIEEYDTETDMWNVWQGELPAKLNSHFATMVQLST